MAPLTVGIEASLEDIAGASVVEADAAADAPAHRGGRATGRISCRGRRGRRLRNWVRPQWECMAACTGVLPPVAGGTRRLHDRATR